MVADGDPERDAVRIAGGGGRLERLECGVGDVELARHVSVLGAVPELGHEADVERVAVGSDPVGLGREDAEIGYARSTAGTGVVLGIGQRDDREVVGLAKGGGGSPAERECTDEPEQRD